MICQMNVHAAFSQSRTNRRALYRSARTEEDPQIIRRMLELLWQKALVFKTPDPAAFAALIPLEKAWQDKHQGTRNALPA